ncbi:hypothetical protein ACWEOE_29635 [Amycolatopsis sp. NPDC004368]
MVDRGGHRGCAVRRRAPASRGGERTDAGAAVMIDVTAVDVAGEGFHGGGIARFAFGLVVISAPDSENEHPGWDAAAQNVHVGEDSLYLGVREAANGRSA